MGSASTPRVQLCYMDPYYFVLEVDYIVSAVLTSAMFCTDLWADILHLVLFADFCFSYTHVYIHCFDCILG